MISGAKQAANRRPPRRAQFSTGPKSSEGKARSSQNSLKHGLSAQKPLIPGENEAEHGAFHKPYEMGLERSLYRALKELQAMRLRQSDKTNPPNPPKCHEISETLLSRNR